MRRWTCILLVACAIAAAPSTRPATRPAAVDEKEVVRQVAMLADADAAKRDEAARRLRSIGNAALPMLQRAIESGDSELAGRAKAVIERIHGKTLPGGLPANGIQPGRISRKFSGDGTIRVEGIFDRRKLALTLKDGITMIVTGISNGQEVTVTFTAADAEELKEQSAEAHALYQQVMAQLEFGLGPLVMDEPMLVLRNRLEQQMNDAATPANRRVEVLSQVAKLRAIRTHDLAETDEVRDRKLEEFFEAADALRTTLAELKLDPGDLLPPPRNARLGVQVIERDERMQVERVVTGSRGDKLGLRPGDFIQRVDVKVVRDVDELRAAMAAARGPLSIEIIRDQKSVTLEEKK